MLPVISRPESERASRVLDTGDCSTMSGVVSLSSSCQVTSVLGIRYLVKSVVLRPTGMTKTGRRQEAEGPCTTGLIQAIIVGIPGISVQ